MLLNPFFLISTSFIIGLFAFSLKWSTAYQEIQLSTVYYISFIVIANFIMAYLTRTQIKSDTNSVKLCYPRIWFMCFILIMVADAVYAKQVPLFNILFNTGIYYKDIPHIPIIYIVNKGLGTFLFVYFFCTYLNSGKRKYLLHVLCILCLLALGVNRGIIVINLLACFILYLYKRKPKVLHIFKYKKLIFFCIVSVFAFSKIGELRSDNYKNQNFLLKNDIQVNEIILYKGQATDEYLNSIIPKSTFWFYAYLASPLANFDSELDKSTEDASVDVFLIHNFFPNFLISILGYEFEKEKKNLILDIFNTYTLYGLSAQHFGKLGVLIFLFISSVILFTIILFVRDSSNKPIILAVLASASLLSVFANMFQSDVIFFSIFFSLIASIKFKI